MCVHATDQDYVPISGRADYEVSITCTAHSPQRFCTAVSYCIYIHTSFITHRPSVCVIWHDFPPVRAFTSIILHVDWHAQLCFLSIVTHVCHFLLPLFLLVPQRVFSEVSLHNKHFSLPFFRCRPPPRPSSESVEVTTFSRTLCR